MFTHELKNEVLKQIEEYQNLLNDIHTNIENNIPANKLWIQLHSKINQDDIRMTEFLSDLEERISGK